MVSGLNLETSAARVRCAADSINCHINEWLSLSMAPREVFVQKFSTKEARMSFRINKTTRKWGKTKPILHSRLARLSLH